MPNHFLTVGLCARDWERLETAGRDDFDFSVNLCEIIKPLPDELQGIVSSHPPCRYVHKETLAVWNEDCNGPMGEDRGDWKRVELEEVEIEYLKAEFGAATWYEWQSEQWGTKWGTYALKVHELGGDGSPVLIEFQTAWGPPSPDMMRAIDQHICETYCLQNITWIGHDPCDGSTMNIPIAD